MADVEVRDILLRCGGRTLHRTGFLAAMGAGRGYVEVKETFTRADAATCATFVDRDVGAGQLVRVAEAGKVRIEYPPALSGLVDQFGYPYCGPSLEGSRKNLCDQSENFGVWSIWTGTPTLTAGQADPYGTTAAYLITDDDAASDEAIFRSIAFTGDGTKAFSLFMRAGTATITTLIAWDNTASAVRYQIAVTWTAGVPAISGAGGSGTNYPVEKIGNTGWYRIKFAANSIIAANNNRFLVYGAQGGVTPVGTTYIFGAQCEDAVFPSSYIKTAGATITRASDSLTLPWNQGPIDYTALMRWARPVHADAVGTTGIFASPFAIGGDGNTYPRSESYFDSTTRAIYSVLKPSAGEQRSTFQAIPAGAELRICEQFKNLTGPPPAATGGKSNIDVGSGPSADSAPAATAFTAFGNQKVSIGHSTGAADAAFATLLDAIFARGQRTFAEMVAIP